MGSSIKLNADIGQVIRLGDQYVQATEVGVRRVAERAEQLVRHHAPEGKDKSTTGIGGNLKQGVTSNVTIKRGGVAQGEVIVSARSGRLGSRKATLHLDDGKTKTITLRPVPSFNYAEAVAKGTGIYGPKGVAIKPKTAKLLLVPVKGVPTLDGKFMPYIESDGQLYITRRTIKGMKPNKYDERAANDLSVEAPRIFDAALKSFIGGTP